jgi:hypothetical protein
LLSDLEDEPPERADDEEDDDFLVLALLPLDLSLAEDGILWYFLFYGGW